jgi:hypothetical protein
MKLLILSVLLLAFGVSLTKGLTCYGCWFTPIDEPSAPTEYEESEECAHPQAQEDLKIDCGSSNITQCVEAQRNESGKGGIFD